MASHLPLSNSKVFTVAFTVWPAYLSSLISSHHFTTCPPCSGCPGFFAIPTRDRTCPHLRALALALYFVWKALPPVACSLISVRSLLHCHLLSKAFLKSSCPHSYRQFPSYSPASFSHIARSPSNFMCIYFCFVFVLAHLSQL